METNMLEKVQELPEAIVNNIYKFLRHPIADIFNEFISDYDIEYVKDLDIIKLHSMNKKEDDESDYDEGPLNPLDIIITICSLSCIFLSKEQN